MNRKDIIRMAREAGFIINDDNPVTWSLERFAALVAAAEREACAKVVDQNANQCGTAARLILESNAAAIRARGEIK